jgi:hypothetical protein
VEDMHQHPIPPRTNNATTRISEEASSLNHPCMVLDVNNPPDPKAEEMAHPPRTKAEETDRKHN